MRKAAANTNRLWRWLPSWQRSLLAVVAVAAALVQLGGSSAAPGDPPNLIGDWSAPQAWPIVAVHMSLEPTGQVFALDGFDDGPNSEHLWNPATGSFLPVPYGRNLFCAGHIQLADGRTLLVGGHINANEGLADTTIFNPNTRTYFRGPDMSVGRWYPTATQLPDGRVLTFAGDNIQINQPGDPAFRESSVNSLPSIYNPTTNAWTDLESARLTSPLYPFMFVLSDGRVFDAGPDKITRILNPATATWTTVGTSPIDGMSAVMYRPNKIMKSGSWADPGFRGTNTYNAHARTAVIDMSAGTPAWRETAAMNRARAYHNLTLLPDGTVLASGGGSTSDGVNIENSVLPAEIWNPDTETWTEVDALQNGRLYHSTALLLPDGRVLMAGGGQLPSVPTIVDQKNAEIYSPPYLFKGPRPTADAPAAAAYGSTFDVTTPNAASIAQVSLIRLPSVTHANDMNQRFQFLNFTTGAGKLTVSAPANANLAPPGDYMLFVLDTQGVPSVAEMIRISTSGDATPPTAPTGLTATPGTGQVALSWTAATDAGGIARYNVHRGTTAGFAPTAANRIAQPTGTTYTDNGLAAGTYYYKVTAEDVEGNVGPASNEASAVVSTGGSPGLVAAYGFDEGSGSTTADQSGGGNNGALSNASWAATGRYGKAISFNGTNSMVTIPDSNALDLTTGMTIEGWVQPTVSNSWETLIVKERPGDLVYGLYSSTDANRPQSQVTIGGTARLLNGPAQIPGGSWTHVAATYDGTTQRLYVNGAQVSTLPIAGTIDTSASPVRIGGNTIWAEWFNGLIDEVRIYNRALSAAEIQTDMNKSISAADAVPPTAPGALTATGGFGQVSLSWAAASDNIAVARYNLHRSTTAGFTPTAANRIAQPTATTYTDTGLAPGPYFYRVTAEDQVGNVGPASNEASATATADTTPPTPPTTLTATPLPGQVSLAWSGATDAGGVARYNVHRSTTSGFTPGPANRIAQPTGTSYVDSGLTGGTYYYRVIAVDAAGNESAPSPQASAVVPTGPPPGLVGEWGFDAGIGTTAADSSGTGNVGTITGPTWSTAGRFGNALTFDGVNDLVTVADANSLDFTNALTLEAWVRPTALGNAWRTTLMKERPGSDSYALYANGSGGTKVPAGEIFTTTYRDATASTQLPLGTWTHIATTYNGTALVIYVNGTAAGQLLTSGPIVVGTGALRIGGNSIWGEWFQGDIDEVRVYNRALTATEIQADMNRPVTNPDGVAPSAPGTLSATGTLTSAQLTWGAATDNIAVVRYNVHRASSPGFTPSAANRIAQPTGTSYTDNVAAGTYFYRVTAEDAAGNVGPPSNEATAQVGDLTPPGAPGTLTAVGSVGKATLSWGAASDNVAVVRYNVHRGPDASFVPSAANRIAQPTSTSYVDTTAPGTYAYKVTAEDAAGNVGAPSNAATATVTTDSTAPTAPSGLAGTVVGATVNLTWTGSTDDVGVARYNVHRGTTVGFTPAPGNRLAQPTGTSYADSGLSSGTYYYKVTAEDAAGNVSQPSNEHTATIADGTAPTAPTAATAIATGSRIDVSWTAATDNVGVVRYNLHRGATSGFTPSAANRIAQPTGTTYADLSLAPGTYFYKLTAEDAAGNVSAVSNTASATVLDTTAPSSPTGLVATGGSGQVSLAWNAASDNVAVVRYNVHRSSTPGFTPAAGNRIAQPTGTSYVDTGLAAGTYYYKVTAEDAAGNLSGPSAEASAAASAPPSVGLVAAYGFDAGAGTTAADQSGNGNTGTITNATWAGATVGRFGNALSFNGTNASVSVPNAASLQPTAGITMEAWVRPATTGGWRTILMKERPGYYDWALYSDTDFNRPSAFVFNSADREVRGTAQVVANTWTHLAATYDGTVLALYVNGTQAATFLTSGAITTNTGALKIGGNAVWGEWFNGLIDEVRIWNRARTPSEIQADMNTSISAPDGTPPSAPGTLTATGGLGQVSLAWGAATDNVAVARYNVHRSTTAGFTPTSGNRIAQPTGTSYSDTGLAAGTYYYKVTAEDAAGNVGPAGNEAQALVTADTTPPSVSITSPSAGATVSGTVTVTAGASDNGTVAGVQFRLNGTNLGQEDTAAPYSISWDTLTSPNGPYSLSAVARDAAGNTTTSANVGVTVQNTASAGIAAAWGFDEGTGTTTADQSGRGNNGALANTSWTTAGRYNKALTFNGTSSVVNVPDSNSLDLTTAMTIEAWVRPTTIGNWRTVLLKEQSGNLVYALYSNVTPGNVPAVELHVGGTLRSLNGTTALPSGTWSHLAATYDGSSARLYVNGTQVSQLAASGSITTSTGALRIGGNNVWGEWLAGQIDEVRVYGRALSAAEIQNDMLLSITPDTTAPTVSATTPANGSAGVNAGTSPTVRFNEPMSSASISSTTFLLNGPGGAVPATVTYDASTFTATVTPQTALAFGTTYTATAKGGSTGVKDYSGNPLATDVSWSFTTEASPPQILVLGSVSNRFGLYLTEILRNEGLNAFTTVDVAFLSPALLASFEVVLLGETALTPAQVTTLSGWVSGGGNLIAMRPDKQLAGLLGLTDAGTTLANAYMRVSTAQAPGAGIYDQTMQFHGTADRYTLNGATAVATLYTNATTATSNPAVTLRDVGASGGQVAAFTYDLARSVVYTRQGNPAWAGQERDGVLGIRPDDMFYGARAGDVQPDWVDTNKIAVPQADEQQRLLLNLITLMERDKLPLPRFWYLPRGEKAVVVMSGDDHSPATAPGGTASHFDRYQALSPAGCSVADWECVRSSSYVFPGATLTNTQAAAYTAAGFEVGVHPLVGSCPSATMTEAQLGTYYDNDLGQFQAKYTSVPAPVSSRTHCVYWPDWASNAKVELARGIRMDANYYHYPGPWIGAKPGFMNGGGFPMRFADIDGTLIDVYQANTNLTDESTTNYATSIAALLDNAVGSAGYYGAFGANMHTDNPAPHPGAEAIVSAALARSVPVISYKQLLTWVDGRNASTIRGLSWNAGTLTFVTTVGAGANGLQTMLPVQGPTGTLTAITRAGNPVLYTVQTIKGIQYALFPAATATYVATYA
jgi:fibronectin type 3 domain-containing protein